MSETEMVEMIHEDALPGDESRLEPRPDWEPFHPGPGRLTGEGALITEGCSITAPHRDGGTIFNG